MKNERAESAKVDLSPTNPFGLTFRAPDRNRNLFIESPDSFGQSTTFLSQDLLREVMLAHLVVRHFPKKIETNFEIKDKRFIDRLYRHYNFDPPRIIKGNEQVCPKFVEPGEKAAEKVVYANAHSGGLDSLYRLTSFSSQRQKMLVVHLRNLNPKGNYKEAVASRNQASVLGMPYEEILLRNGTDNTGFDAMRTRDMFLALVVSMVGENHGVKKVLIEGDMQEDPSAHFSDYKPAWIFFNNLIKDSGLSSQVEGMDAHDIETIDAVIGLESRLGIPILPLVQNCFSAEHQLHNNRRKWERNTQFLAERSPQHWCGSCIKCRRMTLGRIYYNDPRLVGLPVKEINFFVKDTHKWIERYSGNRNLISESFLRHLRELLSRTNVFSTSSR